MTPGESRRAQRGPEAPLAPRGALPTPRRDDPVDAALTSLAAGVAHDVNNLLMAAESLAELAEGELPADAPLHRGAREMVAAARKAAECARRLVAYSGRSPAMRVDVNGILRDASRLADGLPGSTALDVHAGEEALWVDAAPEQLRQMLRDMLAEAAETLETAEGHVSLTIRRDPAGGGGTRARACIEIAANVGARRKLSPSMPGSASTGAESEGGLAAADAIVRRLGGDLQVQREPGRGSWIRLTLPEVPPPPAREQPAERTDRAAVPRLALVVADDPAVRNVLTAMFAHSGCEVVLAEDASSGVARLAEHAVDCAVVDLPLRGASRRRFLDALRKRQPGLPVLLATDASENAEEETAGAGVRLLRRPYGLAALRAALGEAFGTRVD